ncbi:MAG TPA: hypothetical protein VHZ29_15745 [Rhizomicrobium sp.]|jgi:hypothetical protein|nr:hypothetical protein [Rhizomicrobium sp.]
MGNRKQYPDNSGIFARKAEGRKQRAQLTFAEKLDAVDALRERVAPIVRAREARRHAGAPPASNR